MAFISNSVYDRALRAESVHRSNG